MTGGHCRVLVPHIGALRAFALLEPTFGASKWLADGRCCWWLLYENATAWQRRAGVVASVAEKVQRDAPNARSSSRSPRQGDSKSEPRFGIGHWW